MKWTWLVCLCVSSAVFAAPATTKSSGGAATPKEAARNLAVAFTQPTRDGLRACVAGKTPAEEKAADLWAESVAAQFRLQEAVRAKFGEDGYAQFFGHRPTTRPSTEQLVKQVDDVFATAKVEEGGDEARVTLSDGPRSQQIWLTKTADGTWKAWIGAVLAARSTKLIETYVKYNQEFGIVRAQLADDINAGAFKTPQEAKSALNRLEDDEAAKSDPASTQQVATTPQQAQEQLRAQMQQMHDLEAERDRLEKEATTKPIGK